MKRSVVWIVLLSVTICFYGCGGSNTDAESEVAESEESAETVPEEEIPSPRREASGNIAGVNVKIDYGSPSVRGRQIWGELEDFGKVWRAGANATTAIEFDANVKINGEDLPAGRYALFMIPEQDEWTVIFNKDWDEWGAFAYDAAQDVLRLTVTPGWADDVQEELLYDVTDSSLSFSWEKARLDLQIEGSGE